MKRITPEEVQPVPQWMDRPNAPGMWVCLASDKSTFRQPIVCFLSQYDIDRGAPFYTLRVYGPIPTESQGS
jgi:hypothetical protein